MYEDPYSLTHYGVLGMHWGIRKEEDSPVREATKVIKKIDRMKGQTIFNGSMLTNHYARKQYEKALKKDPNFSLNKLPKAEQKKYMGKIYRKTKNGVALNGVTTVVGSAVVFSLIGKYLYRLKPKYNATAVGIIVSGIAATSMMEAHSVNTFVKHTSLLDKLAELEKNPEAKKRIAAWRA